MRIREPTRASHRNTSGTGCDERALCIYVPFCWSHDYFRQCGPRLRNKFENTLCHQPGFTCVTHNNRSILSKHWNIVLLCPANDSMFVVYWLAACRKGISWYVVRHHQKRDVRKLVVPGQLTGASSCVRHSTSSWTCSVTYGSIGELFDSLDSGG
jgi:hypothetical protein